jgi:uncharacterized protein (TIGR00730 family)
LKAEVARRGAPFIHDTQRSALKKRSLSFHPRFGQKAMTAPGEKPNPQKGGRIVVAVFGAAFLEKDGAAYSAARALGQEIARHGWVVASGGYGGAMEAVSRGAAENNGPTIGVTCESLNRIGRRKNVWIREEILRPTARERLFTLVDLAQAMIALDGGIGTLTEIAFCWNQIQVGEIPPRPLILVGTLWRDTFLAFLQTAQDYLKDADRSLLQFTSTTEEAVRIIAEAVSSPDRDPAE